MSMARRHPMDIPTDLLQSQQTRWFQKTWTASFLKTSLGKVRLRRTWLSRTWLKGISKAQPRNAAFRFRATRGDRGEGRPRWEARCSEPGWLEPPAESAGDRAAPNSRQGLELEFWAGLQVSPR